MNLQDCEYIFLRNHPIHMEFGRLCTQYQTAAYPPWVGKFKSQLIRNLYSLVTSLKKPKRKVFLLEGPGAISAILFRRFKNTRILMLNADPIIFQLKHARGLKRIFSLFLLSKVDAFFSPANMMMNESARHFPGKIHRIFHVYVDTERWRPLAIEKLNHDFLYIGRADRFKNQELTLKVFHTIKNKYDLKIRMTIVGFISEEYKPTLQPLLDQSVEITGWRKEPWNNLPAAGYYFNLALLEPSGTNILEALALGLIPIVSVGCGYAKDVVAQIDPKLIVSFEEKSVLEAWEYLHFMEPQTREALRKKCIQLAEVWNRERSLETFKAIFEESIST